MDYRTIDNDGKEPKQRGIVIIDPPGISKAEILMALAGMTHHELPIIVVGQDDTDREKIGSLEELIVMKGREVQELILTLNETPHEELIVPPLQSTHNYHYPKNQQSQSTTKPIQNSRKSFPHRKR